MTPLNFHDRYNSSGAKLKLFHYKGEKETTMHLKPCKRRFSIHIMGH